MRRSSFGWREYGAFLAVLGALALGILVMGIRPSITRQATSSSRALDEASKLWSRKSPNRPDMSVSIGDALAEPGNESEPDSVARAVGFRMRLPSSELATAAGQPKIYGGPGVKDAIRQNTSVERPAPNSVGTEVEAVYPNGLKISIVVRNPEDPTMKDHYERFVSGANADIRGRMAGYLSPNLLATTTVAGFKGFQTDRRWVFTGSTDETPTADRRRPEPAVIGWYDTDTWAQYSAVAPIGVPLSELRQVVDSMY